MVARSSRTKQGRPGGSERDWSSLVAPRTKRLRTKWSHLEQRGGDKEIFGGVILHTLIQSVNINKQLPAQRIRSEQ